MTTGIIGKHEILFTFHKFKEKNKNKNVSSIRKISKINIIHLFWYIIQYIKSCIRMGAILWKTKSINSIPQKVLYFRVYLVLFLYILYNVEKWRGVDWNWNLETSSCLYARPSHTRPRVLAHTHTVKYNGVPNTGSDEQSYYYLLWSLWIQCK